MLKYRSLVAAGLALSLVGATAASAECIQKKSGIDITVAGKISRVKPGNWPGRKEFRIAGCGVLDIVVDEPPRNCVKGKRMVASGTYLTCDEFDYMDGECELDEPDSVMVKSAQCR